MSHELVPQADARFAWNAIHANQQMRNGQLTGELPYHDSQLTAEQAERINQHYSIEVHVGNHGTRRLSEESVFIEEFVKPTPKEYDAAAEVATSLRPGDVLFIEGYGFNNPIAGKDITETVNDYGRPGDFVFLSVRSTLMQEQREMLERQRKEGRISAWVYAAGLAQLRGNTVVYADADAYDVQNPPSLDLSPDMDKNDVSKAMDGFVDRFHRYRERAAVNILKDWALDHLPGDSTPPDDESKRRLVMLFGRGHEEKLKKLFEDRHLAATFARLAYSTEQERLEGSIQPGKVADTIAALGSAMIPSMTPPGSGAFGRLSQRNRRFGDIGRMSGPAKPRTMGSFHRTFKKPDDTGDTEK